MLSDYRPLLLIIPAVVLLWVAFRLAQNGSVNRRVDTLFREHVDALVRRRRHLYRYDAYGTPITAAWHKEIDYFMATIVRPALPKRLLGAFERLHRDSWNRLDAQVTRLQDERDRSVPDLVEGSGEEFEHYCAALLAQRGWQTEVTQGSGDQGVDVVATKGATVVAIQCKRYARAVGNKAVQQAYAGATHYGASHAAVVTTTGYTQAAEDLARSTGVILLHYTDLPRFEHLAKIAAAGDA